MTSASHGVGLGHRTLAEADHWILNLDPAPSLACTHLVTTPDRHVAISLPAGFRDDEPSFEPAATGRHGRAVVFPGVDELTGSLTVAEVLSRSAIDRVEVLGGSEADPDAVVDTRDFVRPQFRDGILTLVTAPAVGGVLVPFEVRDPTPCCAGH